MNRETSIPPISFYIFLSFLLSLLFLTAAVLLMVSLGSVRHGILFIFVLNLIFSPVVGILAWLFDRGSRGHNRSMVLKTVGAYTGMYFGAIAGALIASEKIGSAANLFGFISFSLLGLVVGLKVGPALGGSLARFMDINI